MTDSSAFRAGVQFAVDQIEHLKELDAHDNGCMALENAIQHLEAHLSADAPKLLILPLRWVKEPMQSSSLYAGPIHFGNVYPMRSTKMWQIKCPTMVDVYTLCHPTLEAAKAALEAAVMGLSAGDGT